MLKLFLKLGGKAKPTGEKTYSIKDLGPKPISFFFLAQIPEKSRQKEQIKWRHRTWSSGCLAGNMGHMCTWCGKHWTGVGVLLIPKRNVHLYRGKDELGGRRRDTHPVIRQDSLCTDPPFHEDSTFECPIIRAVVRSHAAMPKMMFGHFIAACIFRAPSRGQVWPMKPRSCPTGLPCYLLQRWENSLPKVKSIVLGMDFKNVFKSI